MYTNQSCNPKPLPMGRNQTQNCEWIVKASAKGGLSKFLMGITIALGTGMAFPLAMPGMTQAASLFPLARPTITGGLPSAKYDESQVVVKKRPEVPFKPRDMMDPGTRKKVNPTDMITLPNGRQVQAGPYYEALNKLEQNMNKLGYSTRDARPAGQRKRVIDIQEIPINKPLFENQGNRVQRELLSPEALKNAPIKSLEDMPLRNQLFEKEVQGLQGVKPRGIEDPPTPEEKAEFLREREQAVADQALSERLESDAELGARIEGEIPEEVLGQEAQSVTEQLMESEPITTRGIDSWTAEDQEEFLQWREARKLSIQELAAEEEASSETTPQEGEVTTRGFLQGLNLSKTASIASIIKSIPPKPTNPTSTSNARAWNWTLGNNTFGAYFRGKAGYDGFSTRVKVNGEAQTGGTVIGSNVTIADANGGVDVPETGNMNATLRLTVVGVTVLNLSKNQNLAWSQTQTVSRSFNKSTPNITIWVGPLPLSVKAGVRGSAGLGYTIGFRPVRAYATLQPSADVSGYAQAGVGADFWIVGASAGVRGTLVLVKVAPAATADITLKVVSFSPPVLSRGTISSGVTAFGPRWAYQSTFAIYVDLSALNGQLNLYAEVTYPCFPDFWNECGDEWTHRLFGWSGFTYRGYLVNETKTVYL